MKVTIIKWFFGWCISFGIIWLITAFFTNPIGEGYWSKKFQRYTYPEGTNILWAEEGRGHTKYGKFGINADSDVLSSTSPKIILWGDSHTQNRHVDDSKKIQSIFNSISLSKNSAYRAINMGMFGQNIAHYCVQIPIYEKLLTNIQHHFIVVSGMKDLLPFTFDSTAQSEPAPILQNNQLILAPGIAETAEAGEIRKFLSTYKLQILKHIKNIILGSEKLNTGPIWMRFNFLGKEQEIIYNTESNDTSKIVTVSNEDYWSFLIKELESSSQLPITIIYSPTFPRLEKNKVVFNSDEEKEFEQFKEKCQQSRIGFIDLNQECIDYYLKYKKFHRGFFNSVPSTGHVNANFNKILARKIYNYILVKELSGISPN